MIFVEQVGSTALDENAVGRNAGCATASSVEQQQTTRGHGNHLDNGTELFRRVDEPRRRAW
ncbi:hypothetical protein [Saccharopolyspora rectivirgula]|uniref:hypothetical protein n=1 Tax=Saccharopolyspora rectivirgula TaxID=28042 RepID=UPI0004150219|nr:hypothetical protein [Saccharopolyspora rectivirgula]